jgi:hypothetical protein
MSFVEKGGENIRKSPILGVAPDPPCTRQVRDTYETGTSHVRASGPGQPSVSTGLMAAGTKAMGSVPAFAPRRWGQTRVSIPVT